MGFTVDEIDFGQDPVAGPGPTPAPVQAGSGFTVADLAPTQDDVGASQSNLKNRLWGTLEAIADITSLARTGGRSMADILRYVAKGDPSSARTIERMQEDARFQRRKSNLLATGAGAFGAHEPRTTLDLAQAESQKNVTYAAPAIALGGAATIPQILAGTVGIAGATLSPFFKRANTKRFMEKVPNPTPGQELLLGAENFGIDLAATTFLPIGTEVAAVDTIDKVNDLRAARVIQKATPAQRKALGQLTDMVNEVIAQRLEGSRRAPPKLDVKDVIKKAGEIKAMFTGGERTGINMIDELLPLLDEAAEMWPKYQGPTSVQAAGGLAGQVMTEQAESLADVGPLRAAYVKNTQMQHEAFLREIAERFQEKFPQGDVGTYMYVYDRFTSGLKKIEQDLWKKVKFTPTFDLTDDAVQGKLIDLIDEADRAEDLLPNWVLDPPNRLTLRGLQNERAALNDIIYRKDALAPGRARQVYFAGKAKDILDDLLEQMPKRNDKAYEAAREATLIYKRLTDPRTPGGQVVTTLMRKIGGGEEDLPTAILKNEKTMERAIALMGGDDAGREALKSVVVSEWFGVPNRKAFGGALMGPDTKDFVTKTPARIRAFADAHENSLRVLFGDEEVTAWLQFDKWLQQAGRERLGTKGAVYGAGSSRLSRMGGVAIEKVSKLRQPFAMAEEAIQGILKGIGDDATYVILQQEAFNDPDLLRRLLRVPTQATLPAYILDWQQTVNAAKARAASQLTARAGDELDNQIDEAERALSISMGVPVERVPQDAIIRYVTEKGR